MSYKDDRLENEKRDPEEGDNLKPIVVPMVLMFFIIFFGLVYLARFTPNTDARLGDSRTVEINLDGSVEAPPEASEEDLNTFEALMDRGKKVYAGSCQACHQPTGAGIVGAFPPLTGSHWVTESPKRLAAIVIHGIEGKINVNGHDYNSTMPAQSQLNSQEMAAVITYVRHSFGNKPVDDVLVTKDFVDTVKEETKDIPGQIQGEAGLNSRSWD